MDYSSTIRGGRDRERQRERDRNGERDIDRERKRERENERTKSVLNAFLWAFRISDLLYFGPQSTSTQCIISENKISRKKIFVMCSESLVNKSFRFS